MKSLPITYSIKNFKAFGAQANSVPLRPITLVFGPNSAGKSSLLHSMLWLNHILQLGELEVNQPQLAIDSIDLGGYTQIIHKHDRGKRVRTEMTFDKDCLSANLTSFFAIKNNITISLSFGYPPQSKIPTVLDHGDQARERSENSLQFMIFKACTPHLVVANCSDASQS